MADKPSTSKNTIRKTSESSENDPTLDFYSDQFDPLKALQSASIKIPVPNAKIYDNLAKYESQVKNVNKDETTSATRTKDSKVKYEPAPSTSFQRKFEPHQMPVPAKGRIKEKKNVVTNMDKFQGPLAQLKLCVDQRTRLKVWTRHSHGIRGYCLAFCVAFDKHWNLALEDVTEVWTRPRSRKVPALDSLVIDQRAYRKKKRIVPPEVKITKRTKKQEYCERYVPQLIVRGEQIAFINVINIKMEIKTGIKSEDI